MNETTGRLRQLLNGPEMLVAPFVYDGLQARIAERTGFDAVYMTGFGTAAGRGFPGSWPADDDGNGPKRSCDRQRGQSSGDLRRRYRLRQSRECLAHRPRIRGSGRRRSAYRGSDLAQALRLPERQAGDSARSDGPEGPCRLRCAPRPGFRHYRPHRRPGRQRLGRRDNARPRLSCCGRRPDFR